MRIEFKSSSNCIIIYVVVRTRNVLNSFIAKWRGEVNCTYPFRKHNSLLAALIVAIGVIVAEIETGGGEGEKRGLHGTNGGGVADLPRWG